MFQRFTRLATLTLLTGLLAVPTAHASTHFSVYVGVPAPVVAAAPIAPPSYAGYWQPGHYVWTRFGYRWMPGEWVRAPYPYRGWAPERWDHERRYWNRERRERNYYRRDWDRDRDRGYWRR